MRKRIHSFWMVPALVLLVVTLCGSAQADDRDLLRSRGVPPNVLLVVDSSGSMTRDVNTDSVSFIASGDDPHSKLHEVKYALQRFFDAYPDFNMGFTFYKRENVKIGPQVFLYVLDESSDHDFSWAIRTRDGAPIAGYERLRNPSLLAGEINRLGDDVPWLGSRYKTSDAFTPLFGPRGTDTYGDWSRDGKKVDFGNGFIENNNSTVYYKGSYYKGEYRVDTFLYEVLFSNGHYFPAYDWNADVKAAVDGFQTLHNSKATTVFDPAATPLQRLEAFEDLEDARAAVQTVLDANQIGSTTLTVMTTLRRCSGYIEDATGECKGGTYSLVDSYQGTLVTAGGMAPWQFDASDSTAGTYPPSAMPLDYYSGTSGGNIWYNSSCGGWQGVFQSDTKTPLIPIPTDDDPDMMPYMRSFLRPQTQMQFHFPNQSEDIYYWPVYWDDQGPEEKDMRRWGVWVTDRQLYGTGATPIKASLNDSEAYFKQVIEDRDDPYKECRKNFVILLTDGLETCDNEDTPCVAATDMGKKGIPVFVIGYGLGTSGNSLECVAKNSNGELYLPNDVEELVEALRNVGQSIEERTRGFAAPMVPSVEITTDQKGFIATFLPLNGRSIWQGHLRAYEVDPMTGTIPLTTDGRPIISEALWDAGYELEGMASIEREIHFGFNNGSGQPGTRKEFVYPTSSSDDRDTLRFLMDDTLLSDAELEETIDFIRGDRDAAKYGTEKLGDVFHAVPALYGPPKCYSCWLNNQHGYRDNMATGTADDGFRGSHTYRRQVLYVAANDGLLHGFDAGLWDPDTGKFDGGSGLELFAWAPQAVMPTYPKLALADDIHFYTTDGSPTVADVYIDRDFTGDPDTSGREWRTVVLAGQRRGGSSYLCLDVTQPDTYDSTSGVTLPDASNSDRRASCRDGGTGCDGVWPAFRWEFTDTSDEDLDGFPDLGQTWSRPLVGFVKVTYNKDGSTVVEERSVALFGGGFDPRGYSGRQLYIVDIETGKILFKTPTWGMVTGDVAAVDYNLDGFLEEVYWADTEGYVYRMDLSQPGAYDTTTERVTSWVSQEFFWAGTNDPLSDYRQPFYLTPALAPGASVTSGKPYIALAIGAGNRDDIFEPNPVPHEFYVVVDRRDYNTVGTITPADLQPVGLTDDDATDNYLNDPALRGWYLILGDNEKVNTAATILNGAVIFSTFKPGEEIIIIDDPDNPGEKLCRRAGDAKTYVMSFFNGNGMTEGARFFEHLGQTMLAGDTGVYLGADGMIHTHLGTDDVRFVSPMAPVQPAVRSVMWKED